MHKWHPDSEMYTKEEMANKKIFTDQQEIALKLVQIKNKSESEFLQEYEEIYGKVELETRFPNILQIYKKYSKFSTKKSFSGDITPKKSNPKAEILKKNAHSDQGIEESKTPFLL